MSCLLWIWLACAFENGLTIYLSTTKEPNNDLYKRFNRNPKSYFILFSILGPLGLLLLSLNALQIIGEYLHDRLDD